jgi:DNA-directed RNA polymerase I, II, and III subunit RPABC5
MIIPVRCYTCGKVIGNKWEPYQNMLKKDLTPGEALDKLNLKKYCCRRIILTHVDIIDSLLKYVDVQNNDNEENLIE